MSEVMEPIILDKTGQAILATLKNIASKNYSGSVFDTAGYHNSIFRGDCLGTEFTDDQSAEIVAGTFRNMFTGDYWTINSVNYRIAGFDLPYNFGDTALSKHTVTIVPDTNLYSAQMNTSNVTTGGYYNSAMRTSNLETAKTKIKAAFGESHIITRRALLTNAVSGDNPSGWAWYDSTCELMTERQVYGSPAWGQAAHCGYDAGADYIQFPLFRLAPQYICNRAWYWLRDVRSSAGFCDVTNNGDANHGGASGSGGVRPAFLIA